MRLIRIYNKFTNRYPHHPQGSTMATTLFMLGGSLMLLLVAVWWVFRG
jgi:hypothetical protein